MYTPLFRARCNSFLRYLAVVDKVQTYQLKDEEFDIASHLVIDRRAERIDNNIVNTNGYKYPNDNTSNGEPHPLVLELAAETEQGSEFLKVYRKNLTAAQ